MRTIAGLLLLVACLIAATWATYSMHGSPKVGVDDANIFFSYSENLAAGNGITYARNPERVEGFTSMLWMLVCAAVFALRMGESALLFVSVSIVLVSQWIMLNAIRRSATESTQRVWQYHGLYLLLVLSCPSYITWVTITLMDTALWGLIVAAMTYVAIWPPVSIRGKIAASVPFVLATAARPEGMLVAPILLGLTWVRSRTTGPCYSTRFCISVGAALVLMVAILTVFRLSYFGYPFPNTFYAKVSPSFVYNLQEGKDYLHRYALSGTVVGVCLVVVVLASASWFSRVAGGVCSTRSLRTIFAVDMKTSTAASLAAFTLLLVPVLTGGDHFNMFRFYQPVYPVLCLVLVLMFSEVRVLDLAGASQCFDRTGRDIVTVLVMGTVSAYWLFAYSSDDSWWRMRWARPIDHEFRIAERGIAQGNELKDLFSHTARLPAIGVITAGGIARTYPGPIVDLMGLNNKVIAHFKGDRKGRKNHAAFEREAFFRVEPDILLASPPMPPETSNCYAVWLKGLLGDPRFTSRWRYGIVSARTNSINSLQAFIKSTFLQEMSSANLVFRDTMVWSNNWVVAEMSSAQQD